MTEEEKKKKANKHLKRIMEEIDPDDKLGVVWAMVNDDGGIDYLSLWAKEIHISSRVPKDIDDKIDEWHKGDSNLPLHEFLGMTEEEYAKWVESKEEE